VFEIDVEVAAFAVFQAVCNEAHEPCPRITEYFNNKKAIRTWLAAETGLHLDDVKAYLSAMHACPGYVWPQLPSLRAFQWIESLRAEIKTVYDLMHRYSPMFSTLLAEARKNKESNVEGAAMSMFREVQERRILEAAAEFLHSERLPVCGLVHDALMFTVPEGVESVLKDEARAEEEADARAKARAEAREARAQARAREKAQKAAAREAEAARAAELRAAQAQQVEAQQDEEAEEEKDEPRPVTLRSRLTQYVKQRLGFPVNFSLEQVWTDAPLKPPREREYFPHFTTFDDVRLHPIHFDETAGIRCLVICAGMNMGKTWNVAKFLASLPRDVAVLIVSTRILHAVSTKSELLKRRGLADRVKCYLDEDLDRADLSNPSAGQITIIQNESLHKLLEKRRDGTQRVAKFGVVVLDEVRSLLKQTTIEKTHRQFLQVNQKLLHDLCLRARCVLLDADVFLDKCVAKFCRTELGGLWDEHELEVRRYTHQALPRTCLVTFSASRFGQALELAVASAKDFRLRTGRSRPVVLNCRCKARVYELLALLFPNADPPEFDPEWCVQGWRQFGDNQAYEFTGDSNQGIELFHDINGFIRTNEVDLIAFSPKLTCAASIDEPVTAVFSDASGQGCVIRDWAQGCGRARNVDRQLMHVLMPKPKVDPSDSEQSEEYEDFIAEKLAARQAKLQARLAQFYPSLVPAAETETELVYQAPSTPTWVVNNLASNMAEDDRSERSPAQETLRVLQYKQWDRVFVDTEPRESHGFFAAVPERRKRNKPQVEARKKRQKVEQAAREQAKAEDLQRWTAALQFMKTTPREDVRKTQRDKQATVWDKACATLVNDFWDHKDELTVEHAQWYWKHRAVLSHAKWLTMSDEELTELDLSDLYFAFKNKNLATAKSVVKVMQTLRSVLAALKISPEAFLAADGTVEVTLEQLQAANAPLTACWEVMHDILKRPRDESRDPGPATLARHILRYFGRTLDAPPQHRKVTRWSLGLNPTFSFLVDRHSKPGCRAQTHKEVQ
jgi:hypothetical protein